MGINHSSYVGSFRKQEVSESDHKGQVNVQCSQNKEDPLTYVRALCLSNGIHIQSSDGKVMQGVRQLYSKRNRIIDHSNDSITLSTSPKVPQDCHYPCVIKIGEMMVKMGYKRINICQDGSGKQSLVIQAMPPGLP